MMTTHIDGIDEKVPMMTSTFSDNYFIKERENCICDCNPPCDILKGQYLENAVPIMTFVQSFKNSCEKRTPSEITFSDRSGIISVLHLTKFGINSFSGIIDYSSTQQNTQSPKKYSTEYHPQIYTYHTLSHSCQALLANDTHTHTHTDTHRHTHRVRDVSCFLWKMFWVTAGAAWARSSALD